MKALYESLLRTRPANAPCGAPLWHSASRGCAYQRAIGSRASLTAVPVAATISMVPSVS